VRRQRDVTYASALGPLLGGACSTRRRTSQSTTLAAGYEEMRSRIVEAIHVVVPDAPANVARSVASFFVAVSDGYMVHWMLQKPRLSAAARHLGLR
jgi:hypothetical protein